MDLPYLNPYLDSIGAPTFEKGCNFAVAGSTIRKATADAFSPFSFDVQVAQFIRFKNRVLDLQHQGMTLDKCFPATGDVFQKALYPFDIGQTDTTSAFNSNTSDEVSSIPTILAVFEDGIKDLNNL
ncbi:hypothetical protein ACH5RR_016477 [Cinchona calisaya]|uniref:Uncharacterized protein n=1 Tax=Cinchona calisaya TaxID=153742 RepID=A0ABD2ZX93_9GENT